MIRWAMIAIIILAGCSLDAPDGDYQALNEWVYDTIEYSTIAKDVFQSPKETLERGAGDCEDYVVLFLHLVEQQHGVRGELVVIGGRNGLHAVALVDGIYYDPTGGRVIAVPEEIVVEVWSYEYMNWLMMWN